MPRDYIEGPRTRGDVRQDAKVSTWIVLALAVLAIAAFLAPALAANIGAIT